MLNASSNHVLSKKQLPIPPYVDFRNIIKIWAVFSLLRNDTYFSAVKVIFFSKLSRWNLCTAF